jgi:hypothetical protein
MWFLRIWKQSVRTIWKSLKNQYRKSLRCYKKSLMDNFGECSEGRMLTETQRLKTVFVRFQVEMRPLLGIGLEVIMAKILSNFDTILRL